MKSIIFNQHQVNHALKNKEGMFRVVVKSRLNHRKTDKSIVCFALSGLSADYPFEVGEAIFVKERLCNDGNQFYYDDEDGTILSKKDDKFWKRNCHKHIINARNCPQWASRLTLRIKSVKVERLADISEEDARKEGIIDGGCGNCGESEFVCKCLHPEPMPIDAFIFQWNSTHKKPEEKWEANPWIFAYEYEVVR